MTGWIAALAIACAACSSHTSENPKPAGEPSSQPKVPKKVPLQIDRQLPDAGWERSADAALKFLKPWLDDEPSFTRLALEPLTAPDGSRIEYLLTYQAFSAKGSEHKGSVLVAADKAVGAGEQGLTRYLHSIGFPGKQIERGLLLEILLLTGVAPSGWGYEPSGFGWPKAFEDDGKRLGRERGILTYDKDGATFTLYRPRPSQLLEERNLADRLVLRFDKDAKITTSSAREQQDRTWTPIAVGR